VLDTLGALNSREEFEAFCRARAAAVYVGDRTILCRVLGSYLCYVDADDAAVAPHLAMDGFWEAWNSVAVGRLVQPGWRVVDVGANHGYFTLLLAGLVGPHGHVFALEPNPRLVDLLRRTIRVNGLADRVTLLPYAAAASAADVTLFVPRGASGDASVTRSAGDGDSWPVRQVRLDAVIEPPIDFAKIDAEGLDYDALAGAVGLFRREWTATVLLEHMAAFHDRPLERVGAWIDAGFGLGYVNERGDVEAATTCDLAADPNRLWHVWLSRVGSRPEQRGARTMGMVATAEAFHLWDV
jgi:FkbM family methyltransferase